MSDACPSERDSEVDLYTKPLPPGTAKCEICKVPISSHKLRIIESGSSKGKLACNYCYATGHDMGEW
jgi:hypothetical protein